MTKYAQKIAAWMICLISVPTYGAEIDGFTEPYREIDVAASESGTLSSLKVEEGDVVAKGQRLGGLDDAVLRAAVDVASQAMRSQGRLRSALAEYRMQLERAEKIKGLRQRGHASAAEYERVVSEYEISRAKVQTMQEELKVKKLEFEQMKAQLGRRQIVSPIDGIVTKVVKDQGEFVSTAEPVVLQVVQLDPLQIIFFVPAEQRHAVRRGDKVDVAIGPNQSTEEATVMFVSPAADAQSGTVRVKVRLPNPDLQRQSGELCHLLLPGQTLEPSESPERQHASFGGE